MGRWWDGAEGKNKLASRSKGFIHVTWLTDGQVAIKYLRPVMVQNVKEKLLKVSRPYVTSHGLHDSSSGCKVRS